ncbi:MAG: hypothetical protein M1155_00180 [Patescibacteria group bacterium]|nr:hypothetical protein [Patescibacteria group bacterium]
MKKAAVKRSSKKINSPVGKFKKHEKEEGKNWLDEEKEWKKDELEDELPITEEDTKDLSSAEDEDDWIEKETGGYDEEESGSVIDDDMIDDKDNY